MLAGVAAAQSNSLLGGPAAPRPPQPAAQPAGDAPVLLTGAPAATTRDEGPASVNAVLTSASPIAVVAPPLRKTQVHDLVTIVVREDKRAVSDAKLTSQKKWELDAELSRWLRLNKHHLVGQDFDVPRPGAEFDFENKYRGSGKVDRVDSLVTRITAQVIDVKPNGNLVLEARKTIKMDEETQVVTLTGTCRSIDLTAQNTVLSTQVADLHVDVQHTGAARDAARRGWLMKAFDFLRPL